MSNKFPFMEEWKEYKLKDICIKITDGSHSSPKGLDDGYPMFSVKDMQEYGFDYSKCKYVSYDDFLSLKQNDCVPQKGDVLVAKDGSYLKQIFVCKETRDEGILSSIAIFRPNTLVDPFFLCYLLKSPEVYNYIANNCVSGSALPRIVLKDFKEVKLRVPSLTKQKEIVSILKSLDDKIEVNRRINDNLEKQSQALFKSWFVDFEPFRDQPFVESELGMIPEGWKVDSLSSIADYINGLAMQKYRPIEGEKGLPVLKIKELGQGNTDDSSELCSPSLIGEKYIIDDGDIIFSWSGTLMVKVWCGGKCGLNQHLFVVEPKDYPHWFAYQWTRHHLDNFIHIAKDKAVTMGHIKRGELDKAKVVVPDETNMAAIDLLMKPLHNQIISNMKEARRLTSLRDTLIPRLM
jgi:type I restriction enzyme S subunit